MIERKCPECGITVVQIRKGGRPKIFCSRICYHKKYDRHPDDIGNEDRNTNCDVCKKHFLKTKRNQRFCSPLCYTRAWQLDRETHNTRVRDRRLAKPEWYREREPIYASTYKKRILQGRPWRYLFQSRKMHAKQKGILFELTDEWARARWNNCCEITGLPFARGGQGGRPGPHPFSPSLDRIEADKGYTANNCRFILWGCNGLKGVGTDEDMYAIAAAITASRKG